MSTANLDPAGAVQTEPETDGVAATSGSEGALAGIRSLIPASPSQSEITQRVAQWALPGLLVLFVAGFSILRPGEFATWSNAKTILYSQAITVVVALAALMPLLAGEVDISVGGNMGAAAVLCAWAYGHHWAAGLIVAATLAFGVIVGFANMILVVKARVNSFIATLAMTTILQGVADLISGNQTLYLGIPKSFNRLVATDVAGVPLLIIYGAIATLVFAYLTSRTAFGRMVRASGSGREAARLIGVNTSRYVASSFLIAGLMAGIAGYLETADLQSADPSGGSNFLLSAIAAVFLGAIVSRRGHLNASGTLLAVLVLGVGITGLTMIGAPEWVPQVFNGVALVLALLVSRAGGRGIAGGLTGS